MRTVKLGGGAGDALYDLAMGVNMREQAELLQDLRQPLPRREFQLYFQPKIDTRTLHADSARSIVRAIVQMAHSLKLRVVAEDVETEKQRDELVRLECDELQGYVFAKPMTAASLALWADGDGEVEVEGAMFRPSLFDPIATAALDPPAGRFTT